MTIKDQKASLRKQMLFQRAKMPKPYKQQYDQWICQTLWQIIEEEAVKTVHCYLPMGTEIDLFPLIKKLLDEKVTVVTPKTLPKRKLQNLVLRSLDEVEKGVFATTHPASKMEYMGDYDLIIVPGLAFDAANYRLGYGGGYYDNFLSSLSGLKIGIGYPFQLMERIPLENHDVKLDRLLLDLGFNI